MATYSHCSSRAFGCALTLSVLALSCSSSPSTPEPDRGGSGGGGNGGSAGMGTSGMGGSGGLLSAAGGAQGGSAGPGAGGDAGFSGSSVAGSGGAPMAAGGSTSIGGSATSGGGGTSATAGTAGSSSGAGGAPPLAGYRMEHLDRGLIAISQGAGKVFLSWRLLGTELEISGFNVYRDGVKISAAPVTNSTNYVDSAGSAAASYTVRSVTAGAEGADSSSAKAWAQPYLEVPLQVPPPSSTPDGSCTYAANDASTADLDGDGQYEIVVKWQPSNAKDNSAAGYTCNTLLDGYKLNGTRLWRIDLGRNIRSGAHYGVQFQVLDYDGDGAAELACQTADGTVDGAGKVIGDASADHRSKDGYVTTRDSTGSRTLPDGTLVADLVGRVLTGPEFLTVFSGRDGRALATVDYVPGRGSLMDWGDLYANRSDRFLAGSAYLDGVLPSIIMGRGYYGRTAITAWDFRDGKLTQRWAFDTNQGHPTFRGQGNHNMSIADVDADGKDEVIYGAMAVDDDGKPMYSTGLGHGDAMHLGDLDPSNPGLEVWDVHESSPDPGKSSELHDAKTGRILWALPADADVGRGLAADIDAASPGHEMWSSRSAGIYSSRGMKLSSFTPSINHRIYWDGDLLDELLDGITITKWNGTGVTQLLSAAGCTAVNGTKANPMLTADILGDWREEAIWPTSNSSRLRIYSTTVLTAERLYTLMHDPVYRLGVAWQNTAYNQPPHLGFNLGAGAANAPRPKIVLTKPSPAVP